MKKAPIILCLLCLLSTSGLAQARPTGATFIGGGGSVNTGGFQVTQEFWLSRDQTPFGVSLTTVQTPSSFTVAGSGLLSLWHTKNFKVHLSTGLAWTLGSKLVAAYYPRDIDLVLALSLSFRVKGPIWTTCQYMQVVPNPVSLMSLGDYARPIVQDTLKGGFLWIGVSAQY